jgi:hypothetical protein
MAKYQVALRRVAWEERWQRPHEHEWVLLLDKVTLTWGTGRTGFLARAPWLCQCGDAKVVEYEV